MIFNNWFLKTECKWEAPDLVEKTDNYRLYWNMLQQPHLLIAGATGSGKSTLIDDLIYTLVSLKAPVSASLVLIDPKEVQLKRWANLPHAINHSTDIDEIGKTLSGLANLMDARFKAMAANNFVQSDEKDIYIIIDEFIDIKILGGKEAEKAIIRTAAKGRAANMHIILATQRPTRDIINGAIKANFPSRVGLSTDGKQESRNIIETSGCELLPRFGYAYYKTPDYRQPTLFELKKTPENHLQSVIKYWNEYKPEKKHKFFWEK